MVRTLNYDNKPCKYVLLAVRSYQLPSERALFISLAVSRSCLLLPTCFEIRDHYLFYPTNLERRHLLKTVIVF